jgi:hypothetical protein
MSPAFVSCEVADGVFALAIDGELVPGAGRGLPCPWPLIADIGPFGLLLARCLHVHRCVVGKERITAPDAPSDLIASGSSSAVDRPTQSAIVERSRSIPSGA